MSVKRPLRIFFGQFNSDTNVYARITDPDDKTFPQFLTGVLIGENAMLHNRIPPDERGNITTFDEYIDLNGTGVTPVPANDVVTFTDSSGVESDILWKTTQQFDLLPNNRISVEGPLIEWKLGTKRLSYPDITSVLPPYAALTPNSHATHVWPDVPVDGNSDTKLQRIYITATIPGSQRDEITSGTVEDLYDSTGGSISYLVIREASNPDWALIEPGYILRNVTQNWEVIALGNLARPAAHPDNISGADERWITWQRYNATFPTGTDTLPNYYGPYVNTPVDVSDFEVADDYIVYEPNYVESHPIKLDYPIDKASPNDFISLSWKNSNQFVVFLQIYRVELIKNIRGGYVEADFPRIVTGYSAWDVLISLPSYTDPLYQGAWFHIDYEIPNLTLTDTFLLTQVRNDAIARLNFDFRKRHRVSGGVRTQQLLILNYDTHHYYIGYLLSVGDVFEVGVSKRTDETGSFILKVTNEGYFIEFNIDESTIVNPDEPQAKWIPLQNTGQPGKPIILPPEPGTVPNYVVVAMDIEVDYGAIVGDYLYDYVSQELGQILSIEIDGSNWGITTDSLNQADETHTFGIYRKIDSPYIQFVTA